MIVFGIRCFAAQPISMCHPTHICLHQKRSSTAQRLLRTQRLACGLDFQALPRLNSRSLLSLRVFALFAHSHGTATGLIKYRSSSMFPTRPWSSKRPTYTSLYSAADNLPDSKLVGNGPPSVVVALRGSRRVPLRHSSRNGSASTSRGTASAVAHRTSPPTWSAHLVVAIDVCCGPLSCELFLPCMPLDDSPLCMDVTSTSQCRLLAAKAATPPIMMHGTLAAVQAIVTFTTSG